MLAYNSKCIYIHSYNVHIYCKTQHHILPLPRLSASKSFSTPSYHIDPQLRIFILNGCQFLKFPGNTLGIREMDFQPILGSQFRKILRADAGWLPVGL